MEAVKEEFVPPLDKFKVPPRETVEPEPLVVNPVLAPVIVTTPEEGVALPESVAMEVTPPSELIAWKEGVALPLLERTKPEVEEEIVVNCPALSQRTT